MAFSPELLDEAVAASQSGDARRAESALGELVAALNEELPDDPLLAACCLELVDEPGLRTELEEVAARATPRQARTHGVLVDPTGMGHVVQVIVELIPGNPKVWTVQPCAPDARLGAQVAIAAALGGQRYVVRWQLSQAVPVHGSSLGLALAVATRAALGRADPEGAWTGAVELDGVVTPVSGMPAKRRAAEAAGLTLRTANHLEQLSSARATASPRNWRPVLLALPVLLAFLGATDPFEALVQGPLLRTLNGTLPAENTAILVLPSTPDRRALRGEAAEIVDALVDVGATTVAFDVLMLAESDHDDALTQSLVRASAEGVRVVLAARLEDGVLTAPVVPGCSVGTVALEEDLLFGVVRRVPVRHRQDDQVTWHLSVEALAGHLGERPELGLDELRIGVTRNPLSGDRMVLPPVAPSPHIAWEGPYDDAAGRVVLVGQASGMADRFRTAGGQRYGVEVHAAAIEAMARQAGLRPVSGLLDALLALVGGLAAFGVARGMRRPRRWLSLGVAVPVLVVLGAAFWGGWLPALLPPLAAVIIGAWSR